MPLAVRKHHKARGDAAMRVIPLSSSSDGSTRITGAQSSFCAGGAGPVLMGCGLGRARPLIAAPPAELLQARSFADVPSGFSLSFSQTGFNSVRVKTRLCVRGSTASDAATPWTSATLARFVSAERADLPQAHLAARIGDAADGGFGHVHSRPWRHYACNR